MYMYVYIYVCIHVHVAILICTYIYITCLYISQRRISKQIFARNLEMIEKTQQTA